MSEEDAVLETIRQAVARSFDAMESQETHSPDEAGAYAANAAFASAMRRDEERRSRRRPRRSRKEEDVSAHSEDEA